MKTYFLKFKILSLLLLTISTNVFAWWNNNWNHKAPITVNNTSATAVSNYEVKLTINTTNAPNFVWANNGDDIRFVDSDDLTLIPHFLEDYDAIGMTAIIWVSVPAIAAAGSRDINFYYDNAAASTTSNASTTFSQSGVKYHSKNSTFDPANQASADSTFEATADGVAGYGCTHFTDYTNKDNAGTIAGGSGTDIIYTTEFFFESTVATTWEFRYGGDSGNGGSIYVDNTLVDELWDPPGTADDMWWGYSWANYTTDQDILYGTQILSVGYHKMRFIGYEPCCDGGATMQYSTNAGVTWQTFNTANISMVSAQCSVNSVTSTFGPEETFDVTIAFINSTLTGDRLSINWVSESENFNLGYNIWVLNKSNNWNKINNNLIPSKAINSLTPLEYSQIIKLDEEITQFQLSTVNTNGKEDFYRSYDLNKSYGTKPQPQKINWSQILQENKQLNHKTPTNKQANNNAITINIQSRETGLMRVYQSDLLPFGLDLAAYPNSDIAVSHKGNAIARNIQTNPKTGQKHIDFFVGQLSPQDSLYLDYSVYQLSINPLLVKEPSINTNINPQSITRNYRKTVKRDQNLTYSLASTYEDPWFEKLLYNAGNGDSYSIDFNLDETVQLQHDLTLNLTMLGLTNFAGNPQTNPDHHLKVLINQHTLYDQRHDGLFKWDITTTINGQLLNHGTNTLTFELVNDTGFAADLVYFDKFNLTYTRNLVASNDVLEFNHKQQNTRFSLSGFSTQDLIAYAENSIGDLYSLPIPTNHLNRDVLFESGFEVTTANNFLLTGINSTNLNHYWIATENQLLRPSSIEAPSLPAIKTNQANYLIIAHPNFINNDLQNFSASKQALGYTTEIINWADIVQQYGYGHETPKALQLFLEDAFQQNPFEYVLLVGGQTYDYNDYLNNNAISFIPTNYRQTSTQINYAPTDYPYTDINHDLQPDYALGRWPVRTIQDLSHIVNKTLQWQQSHPKTENNTLLIAEQKDTNNTDFAGQVDSIAHDLSLNPNLISRVFIDDYLNANDPSPIINARSDIIQQVNNGMDNIIFDGHGSPTSWAYQGIIKSQHISDFNNSNNPTLLSPLSCYTTYYQSPSINTLAHQWLFSGEYGAVAIHGAMVLGFYQSNQRMNVTVLEQMYNQGQTLGKAILTSKQQLQPNDDLRINWNLLGDPSLRF